MFDCSAADWAEWTRVTDVGRCPLDLMQARMARRHYAPHLHEEFSIGVCTTGVEVIRYRGGLHRAGPGSVVILPPGEPHTGGPDAGGFAYRVMYPRTELVADGTDRVPRFREPVVHDPRLAGALLRAYAALRGGTDPLEAESRLSAVLAALVRRYAEPGGDGARSGTGPFARAVMDRLSARLTDPPSLADLAADLGLSRYQVLRCFGQEVGMPPYAWLAQYRVGRARALLEAGLRPAEAASAVGFTDQAHLTRWFRRVVGVTPGAYRNSVRDGVPRRGRR